jgi:hypothetical protein
VKGYADDLELRTALRKPFAKNQIKKLPKVEPKDGKKGRPALDYVSHGVVTDHLNLVVPGWTYQIKSEFVHGGTYWVRGTMTIGDVARDEYGDGDDPKDAIGNFIRRGAMRFGVALDLWIKGEASANSSPARSQEPTSPSSTTGRDGGAEERGAGEAAPAYGEGADGAEPAPQPKPKSDAQRWMEEFHPGKPHKLAQSETVPALKFCTQGNGKCPYAVEVTNA